MYYFLFTDSSYWLEFDLMHHILEMFSSIIYAVGLIHYYSAQFLAVSVSYLISHLTVSDLNTCAAIYLHFLLIYRTQHYFLSGISLCQSGLIHP